MLADEEKVVFYSLKVVVRIKVVVRMLELPMSCVFVFTWLFCEMLLIEIAFDWSSTIALQSRGPDPGMERTQKELFCCQGLVIERNGPRFRRNRCSGSLEIIVR